MHALYEDATDGGWDLEGAQRNDFATVNAYLRTRAGGSILDIGCYTGGFFGALPESFRKYGLEPSRSASDRARAKGIVILGKTLDDLDATHLFDVVVAIDVVEHLLDVESFLLGALAHVDKGGALIISTGNPDSFYWSRVFKSKFWYCSNAEHVVFPSYRYYREFAARCGLPDPEQICFAHRVASFPLAVFYGVSQIIFGLSPVWYRTWRKLLRRMKGNREPLPPDIPLTAPGIFKDHHAIIFRK